MGLFIIEQCDECCWSLAMGDVCVLVWKPGTNLAKTGAKDGMQAQIMAKSASIVVQMYESYIYPMHARLLIWEGLGIWEGGITSRVISIH